MPGEYKSFYKDVGGNEGSKCKYPVRLDTYGCGCRHRTLEDKKWMLKGITGFKYVSVCEDETEAYEYWRDHFNPNPDDCCNLRMEYGK